TLSMLRIDLDALSGSSAPQQIAVIAEALSKVNVNQQTSLAARLFGREGAGDILQSSARREQFNAGVSGSAANAGTWDRNAEAFHRMETSVKQMKEDMVTMWAEVASTAMPLIEKLDSGMKRVLEGFLAAFREGT